MLTFLRKFRKDDSGATAIEYGLIAALVSVAAITALGLMGTTQPIRPAVAARQAVQPVVTRVVPPAARRAVHNIEITAGGGSVERVVAESCPRFNRRHRSQGGSPICPNSLAVNCLF